MGKDLIAEKIIQDLEVYCVHKLCDWKDSLENLNKHVKNCPFAETPAWLSQAQSSYQAEQNFEAVGDIYLQADEHYQERLNEEVPRKSLLERLYTRDLESKELVNTVFNNASTIDENSKETEEEGTSSKKKVRNTRGKGKGKGKAKAEPAAKAPIEVKKSTSLMKDYDDFLCAMDYSDDEEETKDPEALTMDDSSKKKSSPGKEDEVAQNIMGLAQALDFESAKGSLDKNSDKENAIEEEYDAETLINLAKSPTEVTGKRRSNRKKASFEPSIIKKYQVGAV